MNLFVVGCHGGETPKHRTSAFVLDGRLAIDAGALTSGLTLEDQCKLEAVLVSHAHLDHIRDLATIADNRAQRDAPPLVIVGTKFTLGALRKHFFNGLLWPDFSVIPSKRKPTIVYKELTPEKRTKVCGYDVRAILVSHTIETCAFIVERDGRSIAYSGDTGPTERLWTVLNGDKALRAVLMEVSFPNVEHALALVSGHHTPKSLGEDLRKLDKSVPVLLYHIKPVFQKTVERECARLGNSGLEVLELGDQFDF